MKISICIPTYECNGFGVECLEYSFNKMFEQTFKDFDVVISDHSVNNEIEILCSNWGEKLNIKYIKNENARGNPAVNTNNAMKNAQGEWIKILNQDDYLMYSNSLEIISNAMTEDCGWLATGYVHTTDRENYYNYHQPNINSRLFITNTIGTPSCVAFRNIKPVMNMDKNLKYCYDCEYYFRLLILYGTPKLISDVTMATYIWENSITSKITEDFIQNENMYILRKYGLINEDTDT